MDSDVPIIFRDEVKLNCNFVLVLLETMVEKTQVFSIDLTKLS